MKAYRFILLTGILTMFLLAASAGAADTPKIGIIDFQKVLMKSKAGHEVETKMQARGKEMEGKLAGLGKEIEELSKQLDRDAMVMSKDKRDEKQREVEIKKYDFQTLQKKFQSEFRNMESKHLEKLRSDIFSIAENIGKKEGYILIIEKTAVIYYPSAIDITADVIKTYDSQFNGKL